MANFIRPASSIINNNRTNQRLSARMQFPKDIGKHSTVINIKEYAFDPQPNSGRGASVNIRSSVVLPLPDEFSDKTATSVQSSELGLLSSGFAEMLSRLKDGTITGSAESAIKGAGGAVQADIAGGATSMLATFGKAVRSLGRGSGWETGYSALEGNILNPYQVVAFKGVDMISHTFNWTLSPKSSEESDILRQIIRTLKKAALPEYEGITTNETTAETIDTAFLRYPDIVDVFHTGIDQDYFLHYKTSMLTNVSANYKGGGDELFYAGETGSRPVIVELSMSMIEMRIQTKDDFND